MDISTSSHKVAIIKNLYLYLVCFVALMMVVISTSDLIQIVLKKYIFTKADQDMYYQPAMPCPALVAPPEKGVAPMITPEDCKKQQVDAKQQADDNRASQRQRDLVRDISLILVGIPLFAYHWRVVRRKED